MNVFTRPSFWWRVALVAAGLLGILSGSHRLNFYTAQSAVLTVGYFGGVVYWMVRRRTTEPAAPRLRGAVTLWILVTGLVSHFVNNHGESPIPGLLDGDPASLVARRSVFLLHYVLPVMVFVDWVAFGPRRVSPWRDLPLWLIFPLFYVVTSIARANLLPAAPDRYPYAFLNPTAHGYGWVAWWLVKLTIGITLLGALLLGLDRLLARPGHSSPSDGPAGADDPAGPSPVSDATASAPAA
ncbi:Pr6Pr family membrane protein [Luedemannella flava]